MSTEGSGETPSTVPCLPGAPEQTYLFPKAKGHSRSVSHGGTPMLAGNPTAPRPSLKSAMRGHQRALSHGQIGEGGRPSTGPGHSRAGSRTDFILPPGHRDPPVPSAQPRLGSVRIHSRQASRSDSIYTIRRTSVVSPWRRAAFWLLRRQQPAIDTRHLIVTPNHLVPDKTPLKEHPNGKRCDNKIRTTKYTLLSFLPKNLFEQFHRIANVYFIFIVLLNWVPAISAFGKEVAMLPVLFVLGVTAIKDLFEDRRRHNSDKRINNSFCRVFKKSAERYVRVKWRDVRVGDLVHLSNNEAVPADMVLLHSSNALGICYLDTCNLDGETNLKQRLVVPGFKEKQAEFSPIKFRSSVEVERPSTKIYRFTGCIAHPNGARVPLTSENLLLRDCTIKNTDYVEGIVVYAGHETKAMLNNGGPRYKCSGLEKKMNTDVIWCVLVLLFLCCAGAVGCKMWLDRYYNISLYQYTPFITNVNKPAFEGLLIFWTYIIALQVMIPVSLYVTIEMTKLLQVYHIHQDVQMYDPETNTRTECRALNITEELGQVAYLFTDKTGTLTENKMVFRRCAVDGVDYDHPPGPPAEPAEDLPPIVTPVTNVSPNRRMLQHLLDNNDALHTQKVREFLLILAVCNTVVVSQPHVDTMQLSTSNSGEQISSGKASRSNGTLRSNDKYARLTESRSTTPSPPPSSGSPLRIRLPKLLTGSKDDTSAPSPSVDHTLVRYEAESPDELALAEAALAYGYELRMRAPAEVELGVRGALTRMRVLRVQQFDCNRKCMSVAMKTPSGQVVLYVKGADTTVLGALAPMRAGSVELAAYDRTRSLLSEYSRAGLRTLVMAKRTMSPALWEEWVAGHNRAMEMGEGREKRMRASLARLESALALVGATGVEDRLQEDVPRTVRALLDAGLVVWVLTGDKPETAINIAYSAQLFSQSDRLLHLMSRDKEHAESTIKNYLEGSGGVVGGGRALVVDGRTLTYILDRRSGLVAPFLSLARRCSAVLCCRATPLQKAYIVKVHYTLHTTRGEGGAGRHDAGDRGWRQRRVHDTDRRRRHRYIRSGGHAGGDGVGLRGVAVQVHRAATAGARPLVLRPTRAHDPLLLPQKCHVRVPGVLVPAVLRVLVDGDDRPGAPHDLQPHVHRAPAHRHRRVRPRGAGGAADGAAGAVRRGAARPGVPRALVLGRAGRERVRQRGAVLHGHVRLLGLGRGPVGVRPVLHDVLPRRHAAVRRHRDQELDGDPPASADGLAAVVLRPDAGVPVHQRVVPEPAVHVPRDAQHHQGARLLARGGRHHRGRDGAQASVPRHPQHCAPGHAGPREGGAAALAVLRRALPLRAAARHALPGAGRGWTTQAARGRGRHHLSVTFTYTELGCDLIDLL